jgi:hypothetical protein
VSRHNGTQKRYIIRAIPSRPTYTM